MEYVPMALDAKYISDFKIRVTFDNGEQRVADFAKRLKGGMAVCINQSRIKPASGSFVLTDGRSRGQTVPILRRKLFIVKVSGLPGNSAISGLR